MNTGYIWIGCRAHGACPVGRRRGEHVHRSRHYLPRRTLGFFGNVSDVSLYDIWGSEKYTELRSDYMGRELCMGCNVRRPAAI